MCFAHSFEYIENMDRDRAMYFTYSYFDARSLRREKPAMRFHPSEQSKSFAIIMKRTGRHPRVSSDE